MQLERIPGFISGIKCDLCGDEHETDFTYYSLDFKNIKVEGKHYVTNINSATIIFSADACQKCVSQLSELIQIHYTPTPVGVNCDLCGAKMRGSFDFMYCEISEAHVKLSNGHLQCSACSAPVKSADSACKCGCATIAKVGSMRVNAKYLQIALCQKNYGDMVETVMMIRKQASMVAKSTAEQPKL